MSKILKVKIAGQRYRYEVMRVEFDKNCNLLKDSSELKQGGDRNFLRFNDNRLDISDYKELDHIEAGVAIYCRKKEIHFEFGKLSGKIPMKNVLSALNHPILLAQINANIEGGIRLTTATVYDASIIIPIVAILTPPAVDAEAPPENITNSPASLVPSLSAALSTAVKPAVLHVTDWKKELSIFSPNPISPMVSGLFHSRSATISAPPTTYISERISTNFV